MLPLALVLVLGYAVAVTTAASVGAWAGMSAATDVDHLDQSAARASWRTMDAVVGDVVVDKETR
jgi:hypothetical protein